MDSITQGVLGAAIGEVIFGKKIGVKGACLAATFPLKVSSTVGTETICGRPQSPAPAHGDVDWTTTAPMSSEAAAVGTTGFLHAVSRISRE